MADLHDLDWTPLTLKAHLEGQIEALRRQVEASLVAAEALEVTRFDAAKAAVIATERAVEIASQASEKAIAKAEAAAEKRFEAVNEFRGQLADQSNTFMPREVADTQFSAFEERLRKLETQQSATAGGERRREQIGQQIQAWQIWAAGAVVALVAVVANLVTG